MGSTEGFHSEDNVDRFVLPRFRSSHNLEHWIVLRNSAKQCWEPFAFGFGSLQIQCIFGNRIPKKIELLQARTRGVPPRSVRRSEAPDKITVGQRLQYACNGGFLV